MSISTADIRGRFTKTLIDVYIESQAIRPTSFLRSFFPAVTVPTKTFSHEVERGFELVATDVVRGTEGNRNTFSKSTEKITEPPFFREYFDMTELDLYDRVIGSMGSANKSLFKALLQSGMERLGQLRDKIDRAIELQCAGVLKDGIVTAQFGGNFNWQRKSASMVDVGADYFTNAIDPFVVFEKGAKFLRQTGKSGDATFNAILGEDVAAKLLQNAKFKERQNLFHLKLDDVIAPLAVRNAEGSNYIGRVACGAYNVQLWSYPQYYDAPIGTTPETYTSTAYWNKDFVVMFPANPRFKLVHCAVPKLIGAPGQMPIQGAYVMQEFLDERNAKHVMDIQTAPVPVPIAVDQIYTFRANA